MERLIIARLYEIPAQTYIVYSMSLVSTEWYPIFTAVFFVLLSCSGFAFIELTAGKAGRMPLNTKLICLDVICDVVVTMVVPVWHLIPFLLFRPPESDKSFEREKLELWTAGEEAVITSFVEFIFRACPLLIIFVRLRTMEKNWQAIARIKYMAKKRQHTSKTASQIDIAPPWVDSFSRYTVHIGMPCVFIWCAFIITVMITTLTASHCSSLSMATTCGIYVTPLTFDSSYCYCKSMKVDCAELQDKLNWTSDTTRTFLTDYANSAESTSMLRLRLHQCDFKVIPEEVLSLTRLKQLDLYSMQVDRIAFPTESQLITLNMSHVNISDSLSQLPQSLWTLLLNQAEIPVDKFLQSSDKVSRLGVIKVSSSSWTGIPPSIFNLPRLENFEFHESLIREIPEEITKLKSLRLLSITRTRVEKIPEEVTAADEAFCFR